MLACHAEDCGFDPRDIRKIKCSIGRVAYVARFSTLCIGITDTTGSNPVYYTKVDKMCSNHRNDIFHYTLYSVQIGRAHV